MSDSFATPWPIACQAPLSTGFPRQEYWSELPFPSPGGLPDPGIEPASPALAGRFLVFFLTTKPPKKPLVNILHAHGSSRYLFEIYLWQLQNWGWEGVRDGSLAARGLEVYVRVREEWGVHLQGSRCHLCPQITDDAQD